MQVSAKIDHQKKYRLLQLTPVLESSLKAGTLVFKTNLSGDRVFLCTNDSTHAVRKLKQSNSLLISKSSKDSLQVITSPFELLETVETKGEVDWSQFPEYKGARKHVSDAQVDQPHAQFTCSPAEFEAEFRQKPAVELDSIIYKISPDVVHDVLVEIVSEMIEKGDFDLQSSLQSLDLQMQEPLPVITAIYNKFAKDGQLDKEAMSIWTGLYTLKSHKSGIGKAEFLKEWGLDLPFKIATDISLLRGYVIEPRSGWIQYIDPSCLSTDPRSRFEDLFAIKREWPLEEIVPFIEPLVPTGQKLENWILKFVRKQKAGSQIVITPMRKR